MSNNDTTAAGVVIVGVDGSQASKDALRWALGYAHRASAVVHAVTAWQYPYNLAWAALPEVDLEGDTRRALKETIEEVAASYQDVTVRSAAVEGAPAPVLLKAAEHADLLVVGSRGHGAFAGMLLGSVSQHCVHHAHCPVVIVPPPARELKGAGND